MTNGVLSAVVTRENEKNTIVDVQYKAGVNSKVDTGIQWAGSARKNVAIVLLSVAVSGGVSLPIQAMPTQFNATMKISTNNTKTRCLNILKSGNDSYSNNNTNTELFDMNDAKKQTNFVRLDEILALEYDWNCNEAEPFEKMLVDKCKGIVDKLYIQPDIFPTAWDSIQFEYNLSDGRYLEFEVFSDRIEVYLIKSSGEEIEQEIDSEDYIEQMNRLVKEIYEYRG